jgi:uncharacterized protein with HEPN domain
MIIDAVCMRLSAGIEVLARLDPAVRDRMFADDWHHVWGMRNRIAHGYLLVDADIVRKTVDVDLPEIVSVIRREIAGTSMRPAWRRESPCSRTR